MTKLTIKTANLHVHTRCSDGVLTPRQVIDRALTENLDIISITDHDTVEAYRYLAKSHIPLRLLPGLEFSSTWQHADVHILGFGIDIHHQPLLDILHWMHEGRRVRATKMLHKLADMGVKVPMELVLSYAGDKKLIVRPHIAQALMSLGYVTTKQEAFDRYIGNDAPAYVPKPILSSPEVIEYIHAAGGKAIVAHPGKIRNADCLPDLIKNGLDGMEVWHPDHNDKQIKTFTEICNAHGLLKTGGSDYHGEQLALGYLGPVPLQDDVLQDITTIWEDYQCRM